METGRRARMVGWLDSIDVRKMKRITAGYALTIMAAILAPGAGWAEQNKESPLQDTIPISGSEPFFFGRIAFSIMAPDPSVDWASVRDYAGLADAQVFHIGRVDAEKRLTWLETWRRYPLQLPDDIVVGGTPLLGHEVTARFSGARVVDQTPLFFMQNINGEWGEVPVAATAGETRFIRLRWVNGLEKDEPAFVIAEYLEQRSEQIESYLYDREGKVIAIDRQDELGQMQPLWRARP